MTPEGFAVAIPLLDTDMAATRLVAPLTKWGSIGRSTEVGGTYHFYTADYKFNALARDPGRLAPTLCVAAVEVNFSTQPGDDVAVVLENVRRKRSISRHWQSSLGIRVVVDLNVEPEFREVNLRGVPSGWPSYAVRSQRHVDWSVIEADHAAACVVAGGEPALFVVFGGGRAVRDRCASRGWTWVPEPAHVAIGRELAYQSNGVVDHG